MLMFIERSCYENYETRNTCGSGYGVIHHGSQAKIDGCPGRNDLLQVTHNLTNFKHESRVPCHSVESDSKRVRMRVVILSASEHSNIAEMMQHS